MQTSAMSDIVGQVTNTTGLQVTIVDIIRCPAGRVRKRAAVRAHQGTATPVLPELWEHFPRMLN